MCELSILDAVKNVISRHGKKMCNMPQFRDAHLNQSLVQKQ